MLPPMNRAAASSAARRPPGLFVLPFGIIVLLAGLWGGLARLGYVLPASGTSFAQHGFLMSIGFLGTLISTERAVALGRWWSWGVPVFSVVGSVWVVVGWTTWIGYAFFFVAGAILVAVYGRLDQIQRSTHNTLMGLAAVGWAVAAAVAMSGRPISDTVPWLAVFLVITITAERLELSRMLKRSTPVRVSLVVAILAMVAGATLALWVPEVGTRLTGVAMVAMAVWLGIYDLARRTIYAKGVTRFMAAGLLAGYVWLAGGGVLWAIAGDQVNNPAYSSAAFNPLYDAELHGIFLGFVMSMVFAHAPVIAPAVIRRPLPYFPVFYAPLALLHVALILRVLVGDAAGNVKLWQIGGVLNEVALLAFVAVTAGAFGRAAVLHRRERAARAAALAARGAAVAAQPTGDAPPSPAATAHPDPQPVGAAAATAMTVPAQWTVPDPVTGLAPPSRRARIRSGVVGSAIGVAILVGAVLFANSGTTDTGRDATTNPAGTQTGSSNVISAAQAAAGVDVSLVDLKILPANLVVERGAHLVLRVKNNGTMQHDLHLATGPTTPMLDPGQSAVLDAGVINAAVQGWCTVPGHRQAGMVISITVAAPGSSTSGAGADGMAGMAGMGGTSGASGAGTTSSSNDAVSQDLSAAPPAGWKPIDASLPPASDETVHNVTWHIKNVQTAVAPDVTQLLWTFDGRVPGPVLRGKVGDRFNVTVVNDTDMSHNIDFHAEAGPPAKVMAPIPAGGTHTYSFVATQAGAWLYHCAVEPMLLHMGNGMYGAIIIDPPDLAPAKEYVLVGSELFFGPQGEIGDYQKMLADKPDAVVFNGYPFAYQQVPLTAKAGELVRIWVVDAGPTRSLAFHVIGAPLSTVYLDGAYLLKDGMSAGVRSGGAQTLPVDPGDGGFVELRFSEPGTYPFLSHAMADAVIGAAGAFTVTG